MVQRRRDQFTNWHNRKPIADMHELLDMLKPQKKGSYRDRRYLHASGQSSEVEVAWYYEQYCGEDGRGYRYYEVDPGISERAVRERMVELDTINWGGKGFKSHKLTLCDAGRVLLDAYIREQAEEAKNLLLYGGYGTVGDMFEYRAHSRDGDEGEGGELYIEMEAPKGACMRVYTASKRVVCLAKECAA